MEAHHEHAVEGVEASFDFTGWVVAGFGSQFDNERQGAVKLGGIFGKPGVGEQCAVELHELGDDVLVDLQVSGVDDIFAAHHVDERLVPLGHFAVLRVVEIETVDDVSGNFLDIKVVGANKVLNLPHVDEVFGDIFFTFLRSDYHDGGGIRGTKVAKISLKYK